MKKKLLLAPLMAVLVACVVVLSGCGGPSVEELITEDLTTQFDEVKNGGDDFLSGLEEASGDEFEQLGIDPKEYAKTYLEGFDYKIGDVTVDEDKGVATAEVSITCKSMKRSSRTSPPSIRRKSPRLTRFLPMTSCTRWPVRLWSM